MKTEDDGFVSETAESHVSISIGQMIIYEST